jgi:hypothetical protein
MSELDIDQIAEIHRKIDSVLLHDWDPIGVSHAPEAQDEYRGYVRCVYDVAVSTRSANEVAKLLVTIQRESMGLSQGRKLEQLIPVAEKILALVANCKPLA